jgi:hypothetical protein
LPLQHSVCEAAPDHLPQAGTDSKPELKCTYPGCSSNRTFKRKADLNRHKKKHTLEIRLNCPVISCSKQFYRSDKLKSHLLRGHYKHETCTCPIEGCSISNVSLFILERHIEQVYHERGIGEYRIGRNDLVCDLKKCKRSFEEPNDLRQHLSSHDRNERLAQSNILDNMGFDPVTLNIICPVCREKCQDYQHHLEQNHLVVDLPHWDAIIADYGKAGLKPYSWIKPANWVPFNYRHYADDRVLHCSFCGTEMAKLYGDSTHHLGLLDVTGDIYEHRYAILRLLPNFIYHPVFKNDPLFSRAS